MIKQTISIIIFLLLSEQITLADVAKDVEAIFQKYQNNFDFAAAKAETDYLVDQSVSVETQLDQIDRMTRQIKKMLPPNPSDDDKINAIRKFIYERGAWNNYREF